MSNSIKIGIVEDEAMIAENISEILEALGYEITGLCMDYDEAINMLQQSPPDLALLDVKLRDSKDGIAVAEYIRRHHDMPVVFLTANSDTDTVTRAMQVKPNAFLVKPFHKADLYTAIETAISNFTGKEQPPKPADPVTPKSEGFIAKDAIFIKDGNYFHKVKMSDIRYLSSENIYVTVHADRKKHLVRASLTEYLEKFDQQKFVRVHQRFAVNIDHVDKINSTFLTINNEEIPISRAYHPTLLAKLNLG